MGNEYKRYLALDLQILLFLWNGEMSLMRYDGIIDVTTGADPVGV